MKRKLCVSFCSLWHSHAKTVSASKNHINQGHVKYFIMIYVYNLKWLAKTVSYLQLHNSAEFRCFLRIIIGCYLLSRIFFLLHMLTVSVYRINRAKQYGRFRLISQPNKEKRLFLLQFTPSNRIFTTSNIYSLYTLVLQTHYIGDFICQTANRHSAILKGEKQQ